MHLSQVCLLQFEMKRLASVLPILFLLAAAVDAAPVVFVVRHTEKATAGGNDPELSPAGHKRADALAQILKDSQITAVFVPSSSARRKLRRPWRQRRILLPQSFL